MSEMFPVMGGTVIGLLISGLANARWTAWVSTFLSIVCGAAASWISGELEVSWGYLVIDTAQVAIVSLVVWALGAHWPFVVKR